MIIDIREKASKYYDYTTHGINDVQFYKKHINSDSYKILELGCGTGRVLIPLSYNCSFIHGIDLSESMINVCNSKIRNENVSTIKYKIEVGDITSFDIDMKFDLIIAPYRVLQNIETEFEVDNLFKCIKKHIAPGGACILNVFKPISEPDQLRKEWCNIEETFCGEARIGNRTLKYYDRRPKMDKDKLILYPELIYYEYEGAKLIDKTIMNIVMRCYYPDQFINLIESKGFKVIDKWGGYDNEIYGKGSELIVKFIL